MAEQLQVQTTINKSWALSEPPPKKPGENRNLSVHKHCKERKEGIRKQRTLFTLPHLKVPLLGDFPRGQRGAEMAGAGMKHQGEPKGTLSFLLMWALALGTGKAAAATQQHLLLALGALQRLPAAGITECSGMGGTWSIIPGQGHYSRLLQAVCGSCGCCCAHHHPGGSQQSPTAAPQAK